MMIIHEPEYQNKYDHIYISTRVELTDPVSDIPHELWFRFPESYQPYLTERSDGFVTSLLMLAMYLNEPLQVRGAISERLAYGMQEWQRVFFALAPKQLNLVELDFQKLEKARNHDTLGKACSAFSGGLDSLFTLYHHLPQNQPIPAAWLTHALFIHGFDIRLYQEERYNELFEIYEQELEQLGITLLTAQTNAYQFSQLRLKWELAHGGPLIGTALMLGKLLGRFYTNSTSAYSMLNDIFGSSPLSDHLLSSETLEIIHYGAAEMRVTKFPQVADWPVAQRILRVCVDAGSSHGANNCGKCVRCLINIIRLETLGILPKFKTFPQPFNHKSILKLAFAEDIFPTSNLILLRAALSRRRWDIAIPMLLVILISTLRSAFNNLIFYRLPPQTRYKIKYRLFHKKVNYEP